MKIGLDMRKLYEFEPGNPFDMELLQNTIFLQHFNPCFPVHQYRSQTFFHTYCSHETNQSNLRVAFTYIPDKL